MFYIVNDDCRTYDLSVFRVGRESHMRGIFRGSIMNVVNLVSAIERSTPHSFSFARNEFNHRRSLTLIAWYSCFSTSDSSTP